MTSIEKAAGRIREWRRDPIKFVGENFDVTPDKWQAEALKAFASNDPIKQRIALRACAGPGKTACLAWMGWNFLSCYGDKGEHPKGAAASITADNLRDNLWPEFSKWRERSEYLRTAFTWTKERLFANDHPETWFISARSWSKTADAETQGRTLSGLHSKYVLILLDESGDIPPAVLKTGEQALSNCLWGKIVQAGNPTSLTGILHASVTTLRHKWHSIRITGDPDDPNRSPRIDLEWAKEQINTYGRDNPWVMAYVLGEFPPASINCLIGPDEVEAAMHREIGAGMYDWSQKRLGIDAARFGDDPWMICPRQGLKCDAMIEMRNPRTEEILAKIVAKKIEWGSDVEFVDGTGGYGSGVIDGLLVARHKPIEVNFASKAANPRYFNKRSEMLWEAAQWTKRGGCLPNDPVLMKEMTTPTYTFYKSTLRVEEKDQIKKRLGFSPNRFDALGLTFALPDCPKSMTVRQPRRVLIVPPWQRRNRK